MALFRSGYSEAAHKAASQTILPARCPLAGPKPCVWTYATCPVDGNSSGSYSSLQKTSRFMQPIHRAQRRCRGGELHPVDWLHDRQVFRKHEQEPNRIVCFFCGFPRQKRRKGPKGRKGLSDRWSWGVFWSFTSFSSFQCISNVTSLGEFAVVGFVRCSHRRGAGGELSILEPHVAPNPLPSPAQGRRRHLVAIVRRSLFSSQVATRGLLPVCSGDHATCIRRKQGCRSSVPGVGIYSA